MSTLEVIGFVVAIVFGGCAVYAGILLWGLAGAFAAGPWPDRFVGSALIAGGAAVIYAACSGL